MYIDTTGIKIFKNLNYPEIRVDFIDEREYQQLEHDMNDGKFCAVYLEILSGNLYYQTIEVKNYSDFEKYEENLEKDGKYILIFDNVDIDWNDKNKTPYPNNVNYYSSYAWRDGSDSLYFQQIMETAEMFYNNLEEVKK